MARFPDYAPEFRIEIDGDPIPPAMRGSVSRISYTEGIAGASRVEVTLANEQLQWLDHALLDAGLGFELHLGYAPDPLERVFVGEITGVNAITDVSLNDLYDREAVLQKTIFRSNK